LTEVETDLSLLRRFALEGSNDAFSEIVRRYSGVVFAASFRILGDEARAKDVSQETFFRLVQRPQSVTRSLGGWLHQAATHLALDVKRSEKARRNREHVYGSTRQGDVLRWQDISPYIDQALLDLPEGARLLLVRHYMQGTSQTDLAQEQNTSTATICRRIRQALDQLQRALRRRGVYVALVSLSLFCTHELCKAAPLSLMGELGKMSMVSTAPPSMAPPPPPATAAPNAAMSRLLGACGTLGAAAVVVGLIAWYFMPARPDRPLLPAQQISPTTAPIHESHPGVRP
jgi:RNA polymerase sigma-70 factor (ECF subfamily)